MANSLNVTRLANQMAIIAGMDTKGIFGNQLVSTAQFDELKRLKELQDAEAELGEAFEQTFAAINAAQEKLNTLLAEPVVPADPRFTYVLEDAVEGQAAKPAKVIKLQYDTVLLNLIEAGQGDGLLWVNNELVILEYEGDAPAEHSVTLDDDEDGGDIITSVPTE